jgi:hypothetical protein
VPSAPRVIVNEIVEAPDVEAVTSHTSSLPDTLSSIIIVKGTEGQPVVRTTVQVTSVLFNEEDKELETALEE